LHFGRRAFTIAAMPYNWMKIHSSPPKQRRDEVKGKSQSKGGRLCEGQIFYDENGQAYALVEMPSDPAKHQELIAELGGTEVLRLLDADEKDAAG
jgi:hypothetical protein